MKEHTREDYLRKAKRVVVKVGSGVLTAADGLNMSVIENLTIEICALREKGIEVILVSSGAIASGMRKIGMKTRPKSVSQ
ncbi:MAG TPA: glutamate 5-kinase, partial [Deltaproteobacteria bacterium]|nr:glutamate 5-kinase [Deltaproteobacteria bacterium]